MSPMTVMGLLFFIGLFVICLLIIIRDEYRKARRRRYVRRSGVGSVLPGGPHHSTQRPKTQAVPK